MNLWINCYVSDKDGNVVNRHSFTASNEEKMHAMVESFEWAIKLYSNDYTVTHTPLYIIKEGNVYECKK